MQKGGKMSNRRWNTQTTNTRDKSGGSPGIWRDAGTSSAPKAKSMTQGEKTVSVPKGGESGTSRGMGAATKGGKFHVATSSVSVW